MHGDLRVQGSSTRNSASGTPAPRARCGYLEEQHRRESSPASWRAAPIASTRAASPAAPPEQAFESLRNLAEKLGFPRVAFVPVTPTAQEALGLSKLAPAISANVPDEWVRHYMAEKYEAFDPVLLRAPLQTEPLVWDDILTEDRLSPKQRRLLFESREAGLFDGVSFPLHGPRGETYVLSLAAERARESRREHLPMLQMRAAQFLIACSRFAGHAETGSDAVRITDRERECLTWTARGKSAWTIGKILGVSEHTVIFHLKQSMIKLGAANRMQAVVSALRLGLILP